MNNLAKFYKAQTHDYASYFESYHPSSEEVPLNARIKELKDELENARVELAKVQANRYNKDFTSNGKRLVLCYSPRNGESVFRFDVLTGNNIDDEFLTDEDCIFITVHTKSDFFWVNVGYCFSLGAVVSRYYKYKIPTNNNHCLFTLENEVIIPVLEFAASSVFLHKNEGIYPTTNFNIKPFISQMYEIPEEKIGVNYTLREFTTILAKNKSAEVILKTAPIEIQDDLLSLTKDDSEPIYKIIGLTKAEYNQAIEKGILKNWVSFQKIINSLINRENFNFFKFCHYTTEEWFDIILKGKSWDEELEFNHVSCLQGGGDGSGAFNTCLKVYLKTDYSWRNAPFNRFYTFGKFMDYVCEEAVNQGFSSLTSFIIELRDYIDMCCSMGFKPTLYSSYLKQTHDIANRNYQVKLTEEQDQMLENAYKKFKNYTTTDKVYSFIKPKNAEDIKREGSELNHCCATYLSRIIKQTCLIIFLRKTKSIDESLVTIEISDESVVQARGNSNRSITQKEYEAICEFAEARKLSVHVTPRD